SPALRASSSLRARFALSKAACWACRGTARGLRHRWTPKPSPIRASTSSIQGRTDRKSTRLNSSHVSISYAVFCLKKKNKIIYGELNVYTVENGKVNKETEEEKAANVIWIENDN